MTTPPGPRLRRHLQVGLLAAALGLALGAHAKPKDAGAAQVAQGERSGVSAVSAAPGASSPATAPAGNGFAERVRNRASDMVLSAMNFLGVPYKRGGDSVESGFDCSGFTRHVFEASLGLVLPRRSAEQAKSDGLLSIRREELKPGDLVFFNTMKRAFSHVGIYIGDGKFIHSPRSGGQVRVEDMRAAYWTKRYNGARRAAAAQEEAALPAGPQDAGAQGSLVPSLESSLPSAVNATTQLARPKPSY